MIFCFFFRILMLWRAFNYAIKSKSHIISLTLNEIALL
jgi:hypothetical protein